MAGPSPMPAAPPKPARRLVTPLRLWVAFVVVACALLLGDLAVFGIGERAAIWWDERWTRAVEEGERRLAEADALRQGGAADEVVKQRYSEVAEHLRALDARFPARQVKHGREMQRERVLLALARAEEGAGQAPAARATYEALAAFDPRNFHSQLELGLALVRAGDADAAAPAFERVLAIHPECAEALDALIGTHFERADHAKVVEVFRRWLAAEPFAEIVTRAGGREHWIAVPADGRVHWRRAPVGAGAADLVLDVADRVMEVQDPVVARTQLAGIPAQDEATGAALTAVWKRSDGTRITAGDAKPGRLDPRAGGGLARADFAGLGSVHFAFFAIRIPKPVSAGTWERAAASFARLGAGEELAEAAERCLIGERR